jgi:peptidoglycan/xylan/chitin deacetylase (PgdA/CDA1 family)
MRKIACLASAVLAMVVATIGCGGSSPNVVEATGPTQLEIMKAMPVTRPASDYTWIHNAIVRGPRDEKVMSLVFTGGSWGDGLIHILDTLEERGIRGSFYFTGEFLENPEFQAGIRRIIDNGHTIGAHGHGHLLYAPWDDRDKTLVTQQEFADDLRLNMETLLALGVTREDATWWIPPYEWYNRQIVEWSLAEGLRLFNMTPGTLSHTDYTEADAANYRDSEKIFNNILEVESTTPDGLNGFMLLTHVGASPKRPDKFHFLLPRLIDTLQKRGYRFVRAQELLEGAPLLPE